ncbi:hypothetical protein WDU94_004441 [Cyamophila willieti]
MRQAGFSPPRESIVDLCDKCNEQLEKHKKELYCVLWNLYKARIDKENEKEKRQQKIIEKLQEEKLYGQKVKEKQKKLMNPTCQKYPKVKTSTAPFFESIDLLSNNEEFNLEEHQEGKTFRSCSSLTYYDFMDRMVQNSKYRNYCVESDDTDTDSNTTNRTSSSDMISEIPDFCSVDDLNDLFPESLLQVENTETLEENLTKLDHFDENKIEPKEKDNKLIPEQISERHGILEKKTSKEFADDKIRFVSKIEPATFDQAMKLVSDFENMLGEDLMYKSEDETSTSEDDDDTDEESTDFIFMTESALDFEPNSENSSENQSKLELSWDNV